MSRLSKSQFIRGLQCHKSLWLYKNKYELRTEPDAAQQAIFDAGTDVGVFAQQLFPNGHEIIYDYKKIDENVNKTQELIDSETKTIYEASFIYEDVLVMVDILHKGDNGWEMYEVKSSTSVKEVHGNDISIQYYVLKGNGLDISKTALVHINSKYERNGELDIQQLFTIVDITDVAIANQLFVKEQLSSLKGMLEGDIPKIDIGPHCSDPYPCDFKEHCWQHIPKYSIFDIAGLYTKKKFELYNQGILKIEDVPPDYKLSDKQRFQIDTEISMKDFINKDGIMKFLTQLEEPIGLFDFETFQQVVPAFDKQRPYQQIPFQYSLHVLNNSKLDHYEFLGEPGKDPREELVNRMLAQTKECKTILVYNKTFEVQRIKELALHFPDKAEKLNDILNKIVDMMKPFQDKDYYTKEMRGKFSIKLVLPALVPELSYDDLDIADGGMAMSAYAKLQKMSNADEIEKIKSDLLKYCELDTYAMVKILEKLKEGM